MISFLKCPLIPTFLLLIKARRCDQKTEMFSLKDPSFAQEFFACPYFKSDIRKDNRRSHVKLDNILFYFFKKKNEMKRDENETLC